MPQQDELADYIRISVDAVGGINSEEGKEMMRLLLVREHKPAAVKPLTAARLVDDPIGILGAELENAFNSEVAGK